MACSGNPRARQFFKEHGWADQGAAKIDAKYTSRAAELYRAALHKEVTTSDKYNILFDSMLPTVCRDSS
jgi:ADP-ribosylation factor GTPase-activating protein 2/3